MADALAIAARQVNEFLTSIEPFFWRKPITYVDIGAHRGDVFRELVGAGWPRVAEAHLVEPNPASYAALLENVRESGLADHVTCHNLAIGDRPGRLRLRDADDMTKVVGEAGAGTGGETALLDARIFEVEATTLDHLAETFASRRISLLKIDVEGYEAEVLAGARHLLAEQSVDMLYIEAGMNPQGTQQTHLRIIEDALGAHGYRVYRIFEQKNEWPEDSPLLRRINVAWMSPRFAAANPAGLSANLLRFGREAEKLRQALLDQRAGEKTRIEAEKARADQAASERTALEQERLRLARALEEATKAARASETALAAERARAQGAEEERAELETALGEINRRLFETEAALAEERALTGQLRKANLKLDQSLKSTTTALALANKQSRALLSSTSWRVTAPVRVVMDGVKRTRRELSNGVQPTVAKVRRRLRKKLKPRAKSAVQSARRLTAPVSRLVRRVTHVKDDRLITSSGLFDPAWYLAEYPDVAKAGAEPLDHFMTKGWREGRNPSAAFDTIDYLKSWPEVARARVNPLIDYLREGRARGRTIREASSRQQALARATFDPAASEAWTRALRAHPAMARVKANPPLVSIIIPSRDRIKLLPRAIESVLAQTWTHWELVIVDDGSTDGTADTVRMTWPDPRIKVVTTPGLGVSGARNAGLEVAEGTLIAYLDSDNFWMPDYLELMVAEFERSGASSVYSVLKVREENSRAGTTEIWYRATPFDFEQLRFANYIDLNIFMHRAEMHTRFGGFDTSLRRVVDWDLILRYVRHDPVSFACFVGTEYDHSDRDDRLTVRELPAFRNIVRNKHWVDWDQELLRLEDAGSDHPHPRDPDLVSVILCVRGPMGEDEEPLASLFTHQAGRDFELVLVDNGSDAITKALMEDWRARYPSRVRIVDARDNVHFALASNLGFAASSGGIVVFLNEEVRVTPEWLRPMVQALKDPAVLGAQPKVLNPDGTIHSVGHAFTDRSAIPLPLYAGAPGAFAPTNRPRALSAVGPSCMAFRAGDFARLRGFYPLFPSEGADVDFCLRLGGGAPVFRSVPDAIVVQNPPRAPMRAGRIETDRREFVALWKNRITPDAGTHYARDGVTAGPDRPDRAAWVDVGLARFQPTSLATPAAPPAAPVSPPGLDGRTIALRTGCPRPELKDHWGDYHFAVALAAAFQRRGVRARIDFVAERDRHAAPDDINLVLRGRQRYDCKPGTLNLMWLISHPDRVETGELRQFDHVFIASQVWTDHVSRDPAVRCQTLLQCTDGSRFHPDLYDARLRRPTLFVANSRKVMRSVVREAVEQDLPIDIFGEMWEGLAPAEWVKAEAIENVDLPRYYASADVVLNDHWDSMRENGFVSNRIFDVLATGAPLVTDRIIGLPPEIAEACHFFGDGVTLTEAVAAARADRTEPGTLSPHAREVAELVCRDHGFDARAGEILAVISRLLAARTQG